MRQMPLILILGISCFLIACVERASIAPPDAAVAHFNWGISYANQGDLDQAITEFQMAIRRDVRWAKPYYSLGVAYSQKEKWNDAIVAWKRAVYIDPRHANAHYNLARAYALKNWHTLSIVSLREAISLDKKFVETTETDRNFDLIRQNQAYQAFIKSVQ